jgi:hypothetical protein
LGATVNDGKLRYEILKTNELITMLVSNGIMPDVVEYDFNESSKFFSNKYVNEAKSFGSAWGADVSIKGAFISKYEASPLPTQVAVKAANHLCQK